MDELDNATEDLYLSSLASQVEMDKQLDWEVRQMLEMLERDSSSEEE